MKCTFCGKEYEFSLGHRCPVMQEESKQRMTQPDLVSKLREVIAKWRKDFHPEVDPAVKNAVLDCADELESLLGREGQAAGRCHSLSECLCCYGTPPAHQKATFHCQYCERGTVPASPSMPIVPGTPDDPRFNGVVEELVEEFAILDGDIPRLRGILARLQPAAGLSADWPECKDFYDLMQYYRHAPVMDQPFTGKRYEAVKEWLRAQVNALLAVKPVGISIDALEDLMQQFKQREVQIRKDALKELDWQVKELRGRARLEEAESIKSNYEEMNGAPFEKWLDKRIAALAQALQLEEKEGH